MLDSVFLIDLLLGLPAAKERHARIHEAGEDGLLNDVVVCEVRAGLSRADAWRLEALMDALEFVQPGPSTALEAGVMRERARERGRHLSLADSLIAAAAVDIDAAVLTRNVRDFALTPARVESY